MNIFKKNALSSAVASVAGDNGEHDDSGAVRNELNALEAHAEADPAMQAAEALEGFTLTPGAKSLLDRAVDNLATNDGAQIEDMELRTLVKQRASLLSAAGNDLSVAIACIVDACGDEPKAIAPMVYSLCYNALKGAVFFANLDYRRYLDPRGDFDLTPYMRNSVEDEALGTEFAADQREEQRDAPPGLDSTIDREWQHFREVYGAGVEITDDIFAASLVDLRTFLTLTCEAYGWDPERPMPFANIAEKDGTFTPITDAQLALDNAEVQRKERRRLRQLKDGERLAAAAARATERLTAALARK